MGGGAAVSWQMTWALVLETIGDWKGRAGKDENGSRSPKPRNLGEFVPTWNRFANVSEIQCSGGGTHLFSLVSYCSADVRQHGARQRLRSGP